MPRRIADVPVPPECRDMIRADAIVAINHSGGKDSQAMTILLSRIVPRDQLVAVPHQPNQPPYGRCRITGSSQDWTAHPGKSSINKFFPADPGAVERDALRAGSDKRSCGAGPTSWRGQFAERKFPR